MDTLSIIDLRVAVKPSLFDAATPAPAPTMAVTMRDEAIRRCCTGCAGASACKGGCEAKGLYLGRHCIRQSRRRSRWPAARDGMPLRNPRLLEISVSERELSSDGSPGTRKLADCLSDLNAQAAANRRGIALIDELIDEFGLGVVQKYMGFVQDNAELAVRDTLRECAGRLIDERNDGRR